MSYRNTILTAGRLRDVLSYDHETGIFAWTLRLAICISVGDVAGTKTKYGYIVIRIDGHAYMAHRLAWLYVTGAWPNADIDHLDGQRSNNAFQNLRDVPRSINCQNQRRPQASSAHGFMGATPKGIRWTASIRVGGKTMYLGIFDTPEMANNAYIKAKRLHHVGCRI